MNRFLFAVCIIGNAFFWTNPADAHVPVVVNPNSEPDIVIIDDPTLSQAFYGELKQFPHTFELTSTKPFILNTEILVPDIKSSQDIISGIVIRIPEKGGRVEEISRLNAKESNWEREYDPFGGDTYRTGPIYENRVDAGTYQIQIFTPDNIGKYVLVVGKREEMSIGYFELLSRIVEVKRFFEKTPLLIIQSLYAYLPLLLIIILILGVHRFKAKKARKIIS